MTRLPRPVACLVPLALVTWALAPLPIAAAQEPAAQYVLTASPQYTMLPGPTGVTWCAGQVVSEGHPFVDLPWWPGREALRPASLSTPGSDTPVLELRLPVIGNTGNFTLILDPSGRLYYADPSVRVWAYVTPAEFKARVADPERGAVVGAQDVARPDALYHQLTAEPWLYIVSERAPQLLEELGRLHEPLHGPAIPNEPWTNAKPDPEGFLACLVKLLNQVIGDENQAVSLYQRARYADGQLPVQIIDVLRRIHELGGAYDSTPGAPGSAPATPRDDPWARYRPKPKPGEPTPPPSGSQSSPETTHQIRLLNRLLLEYDLGPALQGTLYRWTQDLPDYEPCWSATEPGHSIEGARVLMRSISDLYPVMPMKLEANGGVSLLLERRSADQTGAEFAFYEVRRGGELAGPQPERPPDETTWGTNTRTTFGVFGRQVCWVTVDETHPAAQKGL